jgi:hypothetical protein
MDEYKNVRAILTDKGDFVILDILKNNGLEESDEDYYNKSVNGKEPRFDIVKDTAVTIAQKKISEKKLVELLQKHLETSQSTAQKIVADIKEKLLPLLKIYPEEKFSDPVFREKVSEEIFGHEEESGPEIKKRTDELLQRIRPNQNISTQNQEELSSYDKKVEIKNVEENAKNMQQKGIQRPKETQGSEEQKKVKTVIPPDQKKGPDDYRETID